LDNDNEKELEMKLSVMQYTSEKNPIMKTTHLFTSVIIRKKDLIKKDSHSCFHSKQQASLHHMTIVY